MSAMPPIVLESIRRGYLTRCAKSGCEQSQQGSPYSITWSARDDGEERFTHVVLTVDPEAVLTGKLTGIFAYSGPILRFERPIEQQVQCLAAKIPTQRNREFPSGYQGINYEKQGI